MFLFAIVIVALFILPITVCFSVHYWHGTLIYISYKVGLLFAIVIAALFIFHIMLYFSVQYCHGSLIYSYKVVLLFAIVIAALFIFHIKLTVVKQMRNTQMRNVIITLIVYFSLTD